MNVWHLVLCVVILALAYIFFQYARIRKLPEGTDEMQEMAGIIRDGASTFLKTEFRVIAIVVIVVAAVFSLFVEKTSGITFIMGACMSSVVCILGMRSATYANVRTSNRARETLSIGETVKVALGGGSVSGLAVQAFGMLGMVLVLIIWNGVDPTAVGTGFLANLECNPTIMRITTYSLGCSIVAMFNRVAGGNYTKAADISSDILAKLRHDMPEDDSRVPNVIADFIGDNVNDIAGNCSDLLESFVATMAAALMIAVTIYKSALSGGTEAVTEATFTATTVFPIVLAGCGLFGCLLGLGYATIKKMGDNPSHELNLSTWISAGLTVVGGFVAAKLIFADVPLYASFRCGWLSPWISSVLGIASGVAIGSITEYYTSTDYKPTRRLAEIAAEGDAFVITKGDAIGSRSCLLPVLLIGVSLFISGKVCGTYGIALSSLGMLAFVGATGAGKTTITNLINRFYDIADGKIRYDGININHIKKADLRHSLGIVLQDVNLFTGTVMDNIRYGKLDATDEECIAAAKLANAHDFITRLPDGYNTMLRANGANLSQGQRQLLSIARAAVADPPVMILDEATSSIDTRTELLVQRGMDALMKGRTVFVIAHRLSTVQNSDAIMVLDHGRIIERGTHDDLIAQKGTYYQLYTGAFELE